VASPRAALSPLIAASTHWLARAYPAARTDRLAVTLAELQARQAVTVAAYLRYPTRVDAELVAIAGPGGSAVLDWRAGSEPDDEWAENEGWRTWVDEVVVSWAACLLSDPMLARRAVASVAAVTPPADDRPRPRSTDDLAEFRRLTLPDARDRAAAALLRHPDLVEPIAAMHRTDLLYLLGAESVAA
jgi:hypothetical protein